jgi:hypothetical protein
MIKRAVVKATTCETNFKRFVQTIKWRYYSACNTWWLSLSLQTITFDYTAVKYINPLSRYHSDGLRGRHGGQCVDEAWIECPRCA